MKMMLEGESSTTRTHMANSQTPNHAEAAVPRKAGPIKKILRKLERRYCVNPIRQEVNQAYFRFGIFIICGIYCYSIQNTPYLRAISLFALLATFFWVFMAWRRVGPDKLRHTGALAYDCLIIGLVMVGMGSSFMGLFAVLLWIGIGYGIRYQEPLYLKLGMVFTTVTFIVSGLVTSWTDWGVFLSLFVTLAVVPLMQLAPMTRIIKLLEQLDAANRELDEANKTKTRFISNVSHDLLTPVSSIIGYCGLQPPPIDGIRINAYQLTRQIRAILGKTASEDLTYEEHHEKFDPVDLLRQVATIVKPLAEVNGAQITIINARSFGMFSGAVHALSICLINLVNNAAKHSGGDRIELSAGYEGTMLSFVVSDNGFGIPESQQQLVFQRFHRAGSSTGADGLGLGLSIVRDTIEVVGGQVTLNSSGEGSTFRLTAPAAMLQDTESRPRAAAPLRTAFERVAAVLFVDDEFQSRSAWSAVLREAGYHVHAAGGGIEALAAIDAGNHYDVHVLDYRMPEMNGIELAVAIRARIPGAKIIALSADAADDRALVFEQPLADGLLNAALGKPIHPEKLIASVEQACSSTLIAPLPTDA
ncbi:ATP-binding response regulator [Xanthomonas phaseoli]|uniref:ATP-binding response regulator n=2 Tax=Xanthomonas phaseoli TaxID=1985254 RepID=UPI0012380DCA|nr:hybrid sensor histidine kinase/response regulator [Xanthomonas phaseoli]MBO9834706.1 hybrid sensor histidine kinase/response regulator [Xanthomonas phaseoli pv. dieffenbachiae]MBO9836806.1 hybrid sensor histidine kinase/response regulator [Xanthomonas phaseoli pv. dieffenbachiae]MBO9842822.1 hybrid sensor histidine kinase/response regulator [Xanthomonas phaseoli pv. dieffenbachiae]MBO9863449.1 hybrid sensor histidine kinase/response regulator [Xanthomonas phaseoli pv. dieffenbachiae]MBO9867